MEALPNNRVKILFQFKNERVNKTAKPQKRKTRNLQSEKDKV